MLHISSSISPLTTSSYLNSLVASSSPTVHPVVSAPSQQHPVHSHGIHSQLHGRLSAPNGLGNLPSDDEDIDDDEDAMDENGEQGTPLEGNGSRDGKILTSHLNGDKSGKPRKKKTRTVFSRSQVNRSDCYIFILIFV